MNRRRVAATATLVSAVLATTAVPAWATELGGRRAETHRPQTAVQLLQRAVAAEAATAFSGVALLVCWTDADTASAVVDVVHRPGQGYLVQVRPNANGVGRVLDEDTLSGSSPGAAVSAATLLLFLQHDYSLHTAGADRIAGRVADVVTVDRPDGGVAARFWLDRASGLMLRRDVYDSNGRMTSTSTFVELTVGRATTAFPGVASAPIMLSAPWQRHVDAEQLAAMPRHGWSVPTQIDTSYRLFDARMGAVAEPVLQLTYTDGVSAISVFEQRGRLDEAALTGWHRRQVAGATVWVSGAMPQRLVWSAAGMVYTVVSDAPAGMLDEVVARLPHHSHERGFLGRLWHGLGRIASWLNPFG